MTMATMISILPFAALLLAMAVLPMVAGAFWHRFHPAIAAACAGASIAISLCTQAEAWPLIAVAGEYLTFISLIACLYICAGGIVVRIGRPGTPLTNLMVLLGGAALSNLIGTTGASLVLIRPFMAINAGRLRPYHIVFFIFVVSNIGGCLTPIGDPPLLMGYLRGIDFLRFATLAWWPWVTAMALVLAAFLWCDSRQVAPAGPAEDAAAAGGTAAGDGQRPLVHVRGWPIAGLLVVAVATLFLDPATCSWLPALEFQHHRISIVREAILLAIALAAHRLAEPADQQENRFSLAPISEVAWLFAGIFIAMAPAIALLHAQAASGSIAGLPLTPMVLYGATGICSGVLDNAPTFVAFLSSLEGSTGLSAAELGRSADALVGQRLAAIAVASVFWGALSYIGNGPNLIVKAVAEEARDAQGRAVVAMPDFLAYTLRYAIPFLLPVLLVVGLLFFR
jgi:Na+/H+ antiporter NhaD/arsenite permease-like protein